MSHVHAMSDDQVTKELNKMTAFIREEALQKANEIRTKADHEFEIEKSKLVRQETAAIDAQYEKKFKQAAMSQQITRSTLSNKSRIQLLSARQDLLNNLFDQAAEKIKTISKDKGKYEDILKNLILEAAYALNEEGLQVKARKADYEVVRKAAEKAAAEYKEKVDKEVAVEIDESDPLPEESAGGVIVVGTGGRIDINNTFEERLKLLENDGLPTIRAILFGENKNRKFRD